MCIGTWTVLIRRRRRDQQSVRAYRFLNGGLICGNFGIQGLRASGCEDLLLSRWASYGIRCIDRNQFLVPYRINLQASWIAQDSYFVEPLSSGAFIYPGHVRSSIEALEIWGASGNFSLLQQICSYGYFSAIEVLFWSFYSFRSPLSFLPHVKGEEWPAMTWQLGNRPCFHVARAYAIAWENCPKFMAQRERGKYAWT
jgi:hypothetical protein